MTHAERLSSISRSTHRPPTTCSSIQYSNPRLSPTIFPIDFPVISQHQAPCHCPRTPLQLPRAQTIKPFFDNALEAYRKRTKKDLRSHTLFAKLEACDSPDAVLATLREQISGFDQSGDDKCTKWLKPTVNVLYNFSAAIGGGISLVYPPVGVIFTGIGILLSAATAVSGQDRLADVFERIEYFFSRLETYIDVPATAGMTEMIVKIMTEVLLIAGIATKEIKQGKASERYLKKLLGRTDMEDALCRLDRLTQEEVRMAAAQGLKATHEVDCKVQGVDDKIDIVIDGGKKTRDEIITQFGTQNRNQIRRDLKNWLSPPDSSVNYKHCKRCSPPRHCHVVHRKYYLHGLESVGLIVMDPRKTGIWEECTKFIDHPGYQRHLRCRISSPAYFFFDFKDTGKQDVRALLSSLVIQLSHQSDYFCDILFGYHLTHQSGSQQPSDSTLTQCLEDMLRIPEQVPIYIIIDALDECPNMSGISTPRDKVLMLVEKLVKLKLSNLRLCITSRPEVDIRTSMEPLTSNRISLHDERDKRRTSTTLCTLLFTLTETCGGGGCGQENGDRDAL
ncbi:hypothetical protein BJV74DRAFT_263809 [Russula compacta]|nr:hypothetical protein BJV74DRAFT_263809 [Russula compacta]